jgi:hypothetical protein
MHLTRLCYFQNLMFCFLMSEKWDDEWDWFYCLFEWPIWCPKYWSESDNHDFTKSFIFLLSLCLPLFSHLSFLLVVVSFKTYSSSSFLMLFLGGKLMMRMRRHKLNNLIFKATDPSLARWAVRFKNDLHLHTYRVKSNLVQPLMDYLFMFRLAFHLFTVFLFYPPWCNPLVLCFCTYNLMEKLP